MDLSLGYFVPLIYISVFVPVPDCLDDCSFVVEPKEDTNRWRNIPCSWIGRINIVKMSILPKAIYRFNAIPIKLPMVFFTELVADNLIICIEIQKNLEYPQQPWERRMELEEFTCLTSGYTTKLVIKTVWCWHKDRNIDQWNKIENPEINPRTYGCLIFDKGGKNREKTISGVSILFHWSIFLSLCQ